MPPFLAEGSATIFGIDPAVLEKLGIVGVLVAGVVVLWRSWRGAETKRSDEKDAALAAAQEREREYVETRAKWTATLDSMAANDKAMAEVMRDVKAEVRGVRDHLERHEDKCLGRRTRGGADAAS